MKIIPVKNLNTFKCKGVPHKTLPSENLLIMIVFTTNALITYIIFIRNFHYTMLKISLMLASLPFDT